MMVTWPDRSTRRWIVAPLMGLAWTLLSAWPVIGQDPADPINKIFTDTEKTEAAKKEKLRPPIEFFRSQVLPNDILPYIKANHWTMFGLEMRANHEDYQGSLQSRPVTLADQPHDIIYRRDASLIKGQVARLTMPILLPNIPKELGFQLIRPEAIRQDEDWIASLRPLEPHQQLIVVLSKTANDHFGRWSQFRSTIPLIAKRDDPLTLDKQRYYRMVLPLDPEKPLLSPHPLTWTPISHVIWDGLTPDTLGVGQQQALLDWLHWGGQLIIVGGAGPAFGPLRESFLTPYLPAEPSGENVSRSEAQLQPLSAAYPPPGPGNDPDDPIAQNADESEIRKAFVRYRDPAPIRATDKKPLYITALKPKPGATVIPLGGPNDPPLGVEWKVGRGRVLMLAVSLSDPDLMGWPGFDTMVRRVVLRRPEEKLISGFARDNGLGFIPPRYEPLSGPDLTSVRFLSRDLGAPTRQALDDQGQPIASRAFDGFSFSEVPTIETPVGEWLDSAALPILCRDTLENASGIEIPGRAFVLKVILAYIFVLVPLNYLICRYLLARREWAWVMVPVLSLAFAIGVERAAAYDVGYDSSCDEVDLIETHGDYPRGHLSRFASLYSTGRVKFAISYPNDPTALALPLATGRALRGEDTIQSSFQTQPIPILAGFQVQPRSLAMFRAEQLAALPGTVTISPPGEGPRTIVNDSGLDLNDAWVIEIGKDKDKRKGVFLGAIASGAKLPVGNLEPINSSLPDTNPPEKLSPQPFLDLLLQRSVTTRPEEVGELRLIAWASKTMAGQSIEPPVDRQRGFTLVVAHLQPSPLLAPDVLRYYNRSMITDAAVESSKEGLAKGDPTTRPSEHRGRRGDGVRRAPGDPGSGRAGTMTTITTPNASSSSTKTATPTPSTSTSTSTSPNAPESFRP